MDYRTGNIYADKPLVTIGVLSYNYSRYITSALNSLLTQTYPFIELIIIDDCSKENSVEKIKNWISENKLKCTFIENKQNEGITRVSNKIVTLSKGKYINLFATDDIMLPEKIQRQVAILESAGEEFGMCYANAETMDEDGLPSGFFKNSAELVPYEGEVLKYYVNNLMKFATPTSLISKSVYDKVGLYQEKILIEDYNFWLRVFACFKVKYCEYPCLIYRVKKTSPVWNQWAANNNERYFHDRIISNIQAIPFIKDSEIRKFLGKKINQYLKSLTANNSNLTIKLIGYLLRSGYYKIPLKVYLLQVRTLFK